jgi:hypothetical protein
MDDLTSVPFAFPDVRGQKILVLGLGGGCDVITAYAVAQQLGPDTATVVYANTKTADVGQPDSVTAHIRRVSGPPVGPRGRTHGTTKIDQSVPRGPEGCPWVFLLFEGAAERELVGEMRSLGFDLLVGVDTGGDSIADKGGKGWRGRDQRMLRVLRRTGLPLLHVVAAPGTDGEASYRDLRDSMVAEAAEGRYLGCFSLEPLLPTLRSLSGPLSPTRTPCLILAAAEGRLERTESGLLVVPRGKRPAVPESWLTHAFVFRPAPLEDVP